MIETAIITSIDEQGQTFIQRLKGKECDGCKACDMFGSSSPAIKITNTIQAKSGDIVTISVPGQNMLLAASVVFLLPIFMMMLGYYVGTLLFPANSNHFESWRIASSFLFLGGSFFLVRWIDSQLKDRPGILPQTLNFTNIPGLEPETCENITG